MINLSVIVIFLTEMKRMTGLTLFIKYSFNYILSFNGLKKIRKTNFTLKKICLSHKIIMYYICKIHISIDFNLIQIIYE